MYSLQYVWISLWYLQRGVILTKDNLTKRNWWGSQQCFASAIVMKQSNTFSLTTKHAKAIWRIVYLATGLTQPKTVTHMLGVWLYNLDKTKRMIILVEASLCWSILLLVLTGYFQGHELNTLLGTAATA
jgi:hypothetical protein